MCAHVSAVMGPWRAETTLATLAAAGITPLCGHRIEELVLVHLRCVARRAAARSWRDRVLMTLACSIEPNYSPSAVRSRLLPACKYYNTKVTFACVCPRPVRHSGGTLIDTDAQTLLPPIVAKPSPCTVSESQ